MMKIFSNDDGGLFGVCMGSEPRDGLTDAEIEAEQAVADTQEAFELIMAQTARTTFKDDLHVRLAMSALIGAWGCVTRARAAAGY